MKLGVLLVPQPRASARMARTVEDLGFDSLVFADTQNITPEVWGQLMLAARDTERIELGTGVTNPGTRGVAVTASAALALRCSTRAASTACAVSRRARRAGALCRGHGSLQQETARRISEGTIAPHR